MSRIFDAFDAHQQYEARRARYSDVLRVINKHRGEPMSCLFEKRSNGESRLMRFDGLLETGRDEVSKGLITVIDLDKDAVRRINLDGLFWLEAGGVRYVVREDGALCEESESSEPIVDRDERGDEYRLPEHVDGVRNPDEFEDADAYSDYVSGYFI